MSDFLFDEFDSVSAQAWKQKIQVDLKGADYNETLLWQTNEGITVKPFYHSEDATHISKLATNNWEACELIEVTNAKDANKKAKNSLSRGAESILFKIFNEISLQELIEGIDPKTTLHFSLANYFPNFINDITKLKNANYKLHIDPIGHLAKTGNWYQSLNDDFNFLESIADTSTIAIHTDVYQNAGANITQQIAYAVAHANEYLHKFQEKKELNFLFITATGSNYFFEIAKLRAIRLLFDNIISTYNISVNYQIFSLPTLRNKTIYDYNVNMLRTTTECMSAILGGANTVCNLPYDYIYHNTNEFGDRIARNQLLVLKSESAFDAVQNPADGAYYVESITQQLTEKSLAIFKQIERGGGFLSQLKEGTIQRKIKESAQKELEQFESGELVLLGTNKYPNTNDLMAHDLEKQPFIQKETRKTLIAPIVSKRLSEKSDLKRLQNESQSN